MVEENYGEDVASFFSAVNTGSAGRFAVTVAADGAISSDLAIQMGQVVEISGKVGLAQPPTWGDGTFSVGEGGSLSLNGISLSGGPINILAGAGPVG